MNIRKQLANYVPYNEQEEKDKQHILKCFDLFDDIFSRTSEFVHFSGSAFVVNKQRTKTLLVYHNIYDGWTYPGGHADGEEDLLSVAIREVQEETGVKPKLLSNSIFSLQALPVKGHIKKGKYVCAHTHLDIVYLLEADENEKLSFRKEESQGLKWFTLDQITDNTMVDFNRPIHKKLADKLIMYGQF